ncbi:hypothetical protein JCM17823_28000 [Halorubrum gandharaense]
MTDEHLRATVSLRGVVFVDGAVLVVRRASDGGWELPGGRLAPREDVRDGVRREIREETGLAPTVEEPVHTVSWRNDADEGRLAVYFYGTGESRAVSLSDEHVEAAWERPGAAAERLSTPQGRAVERAATAYRRDSPDRVAASTDTGAGAPSAAENER